MACARKWWRTGVALALLVAIPAAAVSAERVQTPYTAEKQKTVYDFYFDEPQKIASALYWLRAQINPLQEAPYGLPAEFLDIKVVIHGTEIVTVARKNQERFPDIVSRLRYYADLGVDFKVCGLAAEEYGYQAADFYPFIDLVPSAMTELVHWQNQGYALMVPRVLDRQRSVEEMR
jgi:hypothetical protein